MTEKLYPKPTRTLNGVEESDVTSSWTKAEKDDALSTYGCDIIVVDGTWEQVNTKDAPRDAMIIKYSIDGQIHYDLTQPSKRTKLFDMYWDKFREGFIGWEFGSGMINPKSWKYQAPQSKKKK